MRNIQTIFAVITALAGSLSVSLAASQQLIGTSYESFTDSKFCNAVFCIVSFPAIPAGKIIKIVDVVCTVDAPSSPVIAKFGPTAAANVSNWIKETYFDVTFAKEGDLNSYYTLRANSPILLGPGRYPTVAYQADKSGRITITCSLTGTAI